MPVCTHIDTYICVCVVYLVSRLNIKIITEFLSWLSGALKYYASQDFWSKMTLYEFHTSLWEMKIFSVKRVKTWKCFPCQPTIEKLQPKPWMNFLIEPVVSVIPAKVLSLFQSNGLWIWESVSSIFLSWSISIKSAYDKSFSKCFDSSQGLHVICSLILPFSFQSPVKLLLLKNIWIMFWSSSKALIWACSYIWFSRSQPFDQKLIIKMMFDIWMALDDFKEFLLS